MRVSFVLASDSASLVKPPVVGNPPYNSKQLDENDQNKNRKYPAIDSRIAETYTADGTATLRNKLSDPYVRAMRWASDRIGKQGLIALVTNSSYIDQLAFDGMRKHLARDFDTIYIIDLGGNVRKNAKLSGTKHNVFSIQIGVAICLLVRTGREFTKGKILYARMNEFWAKEQKYEYLEAASNYSNLEWRSIVPDAHNNWFIEDDGGTYQEFLPLGDKAFKRRATDGTPVVFHLFSLGVVTSRDAYAYNFDKTRLFETASVLVKTYRDKLAIARQNPTADTESLIDVAAVEIKWTRQTKAALRRRTDCSFRPDAIRAALYRPFTRQNLYFDDFWNEEQYRFKEIFPTPQAEHENLAFCATGPGAERPFACMMSSVICDLNFFGPGTVPQWFPFYTYDEEGGNRRENITDWVLEKYRTHYKDPSISKWNIFYYIYAVLHHPTYRERYALNLKRELPRVPFAPQFHVFASSGVRLADLHVNYESQPEFTLNQIEKAGEPLNLRVKSMRLNADKNSIVYNSFLTLKGIPPETYEYRLGNRSALEWVIDQYQVSTDKRSGITNDPNRAEDPQYISRLIGQVITVSVETNKIVGSLPELGI